MHPPSGSPPVRAGQRPQQKNLKRQRSALQEGKQQRCTPHLNYAGLAGGRTCTALRGPCTFAAVSDPPFDRVIQ